jgi:ADP-dependent NAD(P)H-hydrate dehydratase / NAD(P)H-hydrate epimerase
MPLPVISAAQMREWEQATWAGGQSEREVIRRVGRAVADQALRLTKAGDRILILAGKGNNGQDALLAREHLTERSVDVVEVSDPALDLDRVRGFLARQPELAIDGLFGIGLNRPLSAPWVELLETVNRAGSRVLAVDVPSGLDADTGEPNPTAIRAHVTLTVGAPKRGMVLAPACEFVGRLEVAWDVGLAAAPPGGELQWTIAEDFGRFPPPRASASHKGTYGHSAIVAGSLGYHGAAVLAARGAQRAQPGLITLHTLESVYQVVAAQLQAVMVSPWHPGLDLARPWTALAAGPGLASDEVPEALKKALVAVWSDAEIPVLVDASALQWLPPGPVRNPLVRAVTPHPGEAARLLGRSSREVQANRVQAVRDLSQRFGNVWVVLKGHQTLVGRATGSVYINSSGNAHMAQGGSGDLLTGYIGGLMAQPALQNDMLTLLRYAVWAHGQAADRLTRTRSNWVVEDLADEIGGGG